MSAHSVERRLHPRRTTTAAVQFDHAVSGRTFPGRGMDISAAGLRMSAPAAAPLQAGQEIELTIAAPELADATYVGDGGIRATVIRVDRAPLLAIGHIAVAVRFNNVSPPDRGH